MFMTKQIAQSKPATVAGFDFSKMLVPSAAAATIACSTRTLHRLRKEGKIAGYKVRGRVRFRQEDLAALVAGSKIN